MSLENFWESPGPERFIELALDKLDRLGLVAVHAPERIGKLLLDALKKLAFERSRLQPVCIDMEESGAARSPATLLAHRIQGGQGGRIRTTKDFVSIPNLFTKTVIVSGLNKEAWSLWSGFVSSVRREADGDISKMPRLFVITPANLPQSQIVSAFGRKAIHRWEGIVDRLDMEFWANRECMPATGIMERLARETSLELAGPNIFLLRDLLKLEESQQIEPWDILREAAEGWVGKKSATWREGLVDVWDDAVRVDTMVLALRNQRAVFDKRIWRAQARVLLSFVEDIRSMIIRRHRQYLQELVPWDHPHFNNRNTRNHAQEFDVRDLSLALKFRLSPKEKNLVHIASKEITNPLAHMSPVPYDHVVKLLNMNDEVANPTVEPGWDWPDVGQKLVVLIGSPASGKSTWASKNFLKSEIVSSDEVRESDPKFQGRGRDRAVFEEVRKWVIRLLQEGSNAVIDATHLKAADRQESRNIVPRWIKIEYVVINRPLEDKIRDQGWREQVGENFVREMHDRFQLAKEGIMRGDDDPRVKVIEIEIT